MIEQMRYAAIEGGYQDRLESQPLVVGVSGGPDSVALLHALVTLRGTRAPETLHVAHFDHMLRKEDSEADKRHVEQLASRWSLAFSYASDDVRARAAAQKLSIEDAARLARYGFFGDLVAKLGEDWAVTVAHTADDQAETVLMNLLRGAGLPGLGGIKPVSSLPVSTSSGTTPQTLLRPMLTVSRAEVLRYLSLHDIGYRLDASNDDPAFTRNRIRHRLLPLLAREYNPGIKSHLVTLARIVEQDNHLLELLLDEAWEEIASVDSARASIALDAVKFAALHRALQMRMIRRAFATLAGSANDLDFKHAHDGVALLVSQQNGQVHLPKGIIVEKRDQWVGLRQQQSTASSTAAIEAHATRWPLIGPGEEIAAILGASCELAHGWRCEFDLISPANELYDNYSAAFDFDRLGREGVLIRTRASGDRIQPLGMDGSKSLKELYIDAKIPRIIRDRLALVADAETGDVLWIPGPGGHRSARAIITPHTQRALKLQFVNAQQEQPGV